MLYKRLEELKKSMNKNDYKLLIDAIDADINFGLTLGAEYTEQKLLVVVNSAAKVIKKVHGTYPATN